MTNTIDLNNIPENFVITYFAKKHKKVITRNGSWTKPTDFMTTGKAFISNMVYYVFYIGIMTQNQMRKLINGEWQKIQ